MPSVHAAWPLGQHPTTLLSTSMTQCDPAPHVAGSRESPPMNPHTVLRPSWRRRRSKGFCGAGVAARSGKGTTLRAWWARVVVGGGVRRGRGIIWAVVARGSRALSRRMAVGGGSRSKKSALMVPRCDGEGVKTCGCGCVCMSWATVVLGRRSGGVRAVAVASDRKARRLAVRGEERDKSREEAKLSNREVELRRASVQEGA